MFNLTTTASASAIATAAPTISSITESITLDPAISRDVSSLSSTQAKIISILPIPAALLSIFGSFSIIIMVCRNSRRRCHSSSTSNNNKKWTPYTRLLLGLSCCDIILSITLTLSSYLLPKDTFY